MTIPSSFPEALHLILSGRLADVHTALPARVESYDAKKQTADCKPLLKSRHEDEAGEAQDVEQPVIPNVPVVFPSGGGHRLTFELKKGDGVLLVFSEAAIDAWQKKGGIQPVDERRHHLTDAIAIPGLHDDTAPWKHASGGTSLGPDGGPQVVVTDDTVHLGATLDGLATEPVLMGKSYRDAEDQMLTGLGTQFAAASAALTTASASLATAAGLNAIPMVGGGLAAAPLAIVVAQLAAIGSALTAANQLITQFQGTAPAYLSGKVKVMK